jgi:hypothetical protein
MKQYEGWEQGKGGSVSVSLVVDPDLMTPEVAQVCMYVCMHACMYVCIGVQMYVRETV